MTQRNEYSERTGDPEEELKLVRERFNIIFENTTVSIWDYIFETKQIIQPVRSQEFHGFDTVIENVPESLIESGFVHPDSARAFREMYEKLFAGEPHAEGIFRVQTPDRTGYWYEHIRYNTLFNEQGIPYAAVGFSTDDTQEVENRLEITRWKELLAGALGKRIVVIEFDLTNDAMVKLESSDYDQDIKNLPSGFDAFIELYITKNVHMMDAPRVKKRLQRSCLLEDFVDGKYEFSMEYRMRYREGFCWVRLNTRMVYLEVDNAIHFYMLHSDITEQKEQELELLRKAETDPVSGLLNHGAFQEKANKLWEQFPEYPFILVLMDMDNFKDINDTYGHGEGDKALAYTARCMEAVLEEVRACAITARAGGDEFALLFYGEGREKAEDVIRRLLEKMAEPSVDGIRLSVSIGAAVSPKDGGSFERLGVAADRALYHVKRNGKSDYCFYDDIFQSDPGLVQRRQQFLSDTLSGGMIGRYIEEGFPLYFIDDALLHWLGYEKESVFAEAVGGLVQELVHPDDRDFVFRSVMQQVTANGKYAVDYRMRKKDGSYIWVHDVGERMTAPDGREALTAVCYDITLEKEHDKLLRQLVADADGAIGLYRIEADRRLITLYISEGLGSLGGYSDGEYLQMCQADAMDSVYKEDREDVLNAMVKAVSEDSVTTACYRIFRKDGVCIWITGTFSRYGEDQGRPVLRAVYMPLPIQYDLQLQTLDSDTIGVYVIDQYTDELYYANDSSFRLLGVPVCGNYTGKTCHEVYHDRPAPCADCILQRAHRNEGEELYYYLKDRILHVEVQERKWNGRDIAIVYIREVTDQIRTRDELQKTVAELTRVEKSLRRNQDMMEAACSFANIWVFAYDMDRQMAFPGNKLQQEFGFPARIDGFPEAIFSYHLILPEYANLYREQFAMLKNGQSEISFEIQSLLTDDKIHWLRFKGQVLPRQAGEPRMATVSAQIIDTEKAMEARLELEREKQQRSEENLLYFYSGNLTKNIVMECQGRLYQAPVDVRTLPLDQFIRMGYSRLMGEDAKKAAEQFYDRETLLNKYGRGIIQDEFEGQLTKKDGQIIWTRHLIRLLQNPSTRDILIYEYAYDISKEKILNAMLQMEMGYGYEVIGNLVAEGDQCTFLEIDPQTGHSELRYVIFTDYVRNYAKACMHPDDVEAYVRHYESIREIADGCESGHAEVLYRTIGEDGSIHYHKDDNYFYDKEHGVYLLTRREYTDVVKAEEAERQRLMDALEQARIANNAKSNFLSRMSHEIRTPMNAILGMSYLVADEVEKDSIAAGYIEQINQSSQYLLGIINDILDMSRIESGQTALNPDWYTLEELVSPIIHMIEPTLREKGISFEYNKNGFTRWKMEYYMDRQKTQQMLMNLLNNACKFTPPGGEIRVRSANLSLDREACVSTDQVIISDTGCGMSEEFMSRLFEPFEQERLSGMEQIPGTGLGLSIARSIARKMGGDITARSELGKGSEFKVTFTYRFRPIEEAKKEEQAAEETADLAGKSILLAEDNEINAAIAVALLEKQGITTDVAPNGKLALERFASAPEKTYDMILMDIQMPVMDGLEAASRIRALERPDAGLIPIVAMSANAYEEDRQKSLRAGMNDHLSKPVDPKAMYAMIARYCR